MRSIFWVAMSTCGAMGDTGLWGLFHKGPNPVHNTTLMTLRSSQSIPSTSKQHHLGVRISTYKFWRNTNIQTLAGDNIRAWYTYANKAWYTYAWYTCANTLMQTKETHDCSISEPAVPLSTLMTHNEDQVPVEIMGKNAIVVTLKSGLILTSWSLMQIYLSFMIPMKNMRWSWSWNLECSHWESTLPDAGNFYRAHIQCEALYCGHIPLSLASHTGSGRYLMQGIWWRKEGRNG